MEFNIILIALVLLSIAIGALAEKNISLKEWNDTLSKSNSTMADIIRQANTQDVAPRRLEDKE